LFFKTFTSTHCFTDSLKALHSLIVVILNQFIVAFIFALYLSIQSLWWWSQSFLSS